MSFCNSLTFFRIWASAKFQPISNVIWQSHGVHFVNINVYAKCHHIIPLSSRDSAIITFSEFGARPMLHVIFQFLELDLVNINVSDDKWHFAICWTRCRQYQCICKILWKYSKRFKNYRHFSRTGRWQKLHKLSGDKIKCLIIGHTMKVNLQFQLTFLGSCNSVC